MQNNQSTKSFLSQFRHDLKNDLTVIRLNLSLLQRNPEKREELIQKIDGKIEKILKDLTVMKSTLG